MHPPQKKNTLIPMLIGSFSSISFSLRATLAPVVVVASSVGQLLYLYDQREPPLLLHQQKFLCSEVLLALPISRVH